MKLSKSLLGAIVIGVALQAASCKKDKDQAKPDTEKAGGKKGTPLPGGCPFCGRG